MEKETEEKISQLTQLEQNAHQFLNQRQLLQTQILEIESALNELKTTENSYKIIGNIMISANKDNLEKELKSKEEMLNMKVNSIEKQEKKIKEKASELQKEVMEKLK